MKTQDQPSQANALAANPDFIAFLASQKKGIGRSATINRAFRCEDNGEVIEGTFETLDLPGNAWKRPSREAFFRELGRIRGLDEDTLKRDAKLTWN